MIISRRFVIASGLSLLAGMPLSSLARAAGGEGVLAPFEGLEDFWLATDAYIYGYPLVTMEMTRRVITNVAAPEGIRAPMGQLIKLREYPNASFRDVTAPNADTLYTTAFFDVGKEPWVLSLTDMKDRYYLMPLLDGWTTVFQVPGTRTTGGGAQTYAITGPGWTGALPAGVKEYKSPTSIVWLLSRIYCTGTPEDYAAVHALQDQVKLVPLSAYGQPYTPPPGKVDPSIDMKTAVRDQVNRLDTTAYFTLLAQLMKASPPGPADAPEVARFASTGSRFRCREAQRRFRQADPGDGVRPDHAPVQGQSCAKKHQWLGLYDEDRSLRNRLSDAGVRHSYRTWRQPPAGRRLPHLAEGADGRDHDGANRYVIHFAKGQTPPAEGFWSITMYDANYFFVENQINRYSISPRQNLKQNADGSVDIYIQKESPGADREANWLPSPAGKFILMTRLYWPNEADPSILDGSWTLPPVTKAVG